jgi:hypothetical protein
VTGIAARGLPNVRRRCRGRILAGGRGRLDPRRGFVEIAGHKKDFAMDTQSTPRRRILWQNVITVLSAAVLISAEVLGAVVMVRFVRNGMRVEPFTAPL